MSLLPVSGGMPMLFLEARMLGIGQPSALVSQLGISLDAPDVNVGLFSRASGVFLVAGVGSYAAYRICTKYLGRSFVWMLLESASCDQLATADRRLLYGQGATIEEIDEEEEEEEDRNSEAEWRSRVSESRPASEFSVSRLSRLRRSVRGKGLLSLRAPRGVREGVVARSASGSVCSSRSRAVSPAASECSASLRIVWEGQQQWDDEFATGDDLRVPSATPSRLGIAHRLPLHSTPLHPAPSIGDMCSVFDDILSVTTGADLDDSPTHHAVLEDEDEALECGDDAELSRLRCLHDSAYMYQSVCVAGSEFGGSDAMSVCSARSSASNLFSLKKRLNRSAKPSGLWDLTPTSAEENPMTDSGVAMIRSSHSKQSNGRSMFDSAIGADVLSSGDEEEARDKAGLTRIGETSSLSHAPSTLSLEWFDEGLKERASAMGSAMEGDLGVAIPIGDVEWEFEQHDDDDTSVAGTSHAGLSSLPPIPSTAFSRSHLRNTRDLVVFARQHFKTDSTQFKLLQQLHHKRRLRRVGGQATDRENNSNHVEEGKEQVLSSFLTQAIYHGVPVPPMAPTAAVKKLHECVSSCDFLRRQEGGVERMQQLITKLAHTVAGSGEVTSESVVGLRLLITLKAIDIYHRKLDGVEYPWFTVDNPADVMRLLESDGVMGEMEWHLLAETCGVKIELVDLTSLSPSSMTVFRPRGDSLAPALPWLTHPHPLPLFLLPDDESEV